MSYIEENPCERKPSLSALKKLKEAVLPPSFLISPYDALTPPYASELSARFSDWQPEDLDALMADHEAEIEILRGYVDCGLERLMKECAELVKRDRDEVGSEDEVKGRDEEQDEDVEM